MSPTPNQPSQKPPVAAEQGMTIPVYDRAWMPFWSLRREVDDLFDDFFRSGRIGWPMARPSARGPVPGLSMAMPQLDVIDKEDEVKLVADLPGLTDAEITVEVTDGTLTISGEKREEIEDGDAEGERYLSERRFGRFTRRIALPEGIDQDKIDARFKNGVLTVHLPKRPEAQSPARKIAVRAEA